MTPEIQAQPRDPVLFQERYQAWAKLPATENHHFAARQIAWDLYCDARDGLPDGTTATRRSLTPATRENEPVQLDIFRRRHS